MRRERKKKMPYTNFQSGITSRGVALPGFIQTITDTVYTIKAGDNGCLLRFTSNSPVTVTCPGGLYVGTIPSGVFGEMPPLFELRAEQVGTGAITFVAGSGVSINGQGGIVATSAQWALATLTADSITTWVVGLESATGSPGGSPDEIQYNADGAFGGIPVGTTGQVLTSNGSGVPPSMKDAPSGTSALIASAIGVDLNAAGDTAMTLSAFATGKFFVVDYVLVTNASINPDTATVGVFSGAAATGQIYLGPASTFDTLSSARHWSARGSDNSIVNGSANGTMVNTAPIINVGTPQGAAATADFYMFGRTDPWA